MEGIYTVAHKNAPQLSVPNKMKVDRKFVRKKCTLKLQTHH